MAQVQGWCEDRFDAVHETVDSLLEAGDASASVAVLVDGDPVVDLWGGWADPDRTAPWEQGTITGLWSVTKTMTALCALLLVDRGLLDLDAPVARYWPEFARHGKAAVLVRQVLSHTAGLPDWEGPVEKLYDPAAASARLAGLAPRWPPGTAAGYHSLTQGVLLGELVRRTTGADVGELFAAEVAGRLGADVHLGLGAEHDHRVAPTVPPPPFGEDYTARAAASPAHPPAPADAPSSSADGRPTPVTVRDGNSLAWRRAQVPAASGFGSARAVALVQSVLACGGTVGGTRVLSPTTCDLARREEFSGTDRVLGTPVSWGLGYARFGSSLGWGGWGGSLVMLDPDARTVVAYVTSQMREPEDDDRGLALVVAAYEGLATLRR